MSWSFFYLYYVQVHQQWITEFQSSTQCVINVNLTGDIKHIARVFLSALPSELIIYFWNILECLPQSHIASISIQTTLQQRLSTPNNCHWKINIYYTRVFAVCTDLFRFWSLALRLWRVPLTPFGKSLEELHTKHPAERDISFLNSCASLLPDLIRQTLK